MPTPEDFAYALQGKRRYATDDPVAGYQAPTEGMAPFGYMPTSTEAEAMTHKTDTRKSLPDIWQESGALGKAAIAAAGLPYGLAKTIAAPVQAAADLTRQAQRGEFVSNDPENINKANAAAALVVGGGMPFAKPGAVGMGGGKLITPAAERAAGTAGAPFYSAAEQAIANAKLNKAPIDQWHNYLKGQPGVKAEELAQLGITPENAAAMPGALTKEQLREHALANQVQLKEVTKGAASGWTPENVDRLNQLSLRRMRGGLDEAGEREYQFLTEMQDKALAPGETVQPTKFSQYQLPGGSNYGETLLTMPPRQVDPVAYAKNFYESTGQFSPQVPWEKLDETSRQGWINAVNDQVNKMGKGGDNYTSSHWDEPNVLVHMRHNDRELPGVGNALHLEEIQSDLHQQGRKQGYDVQFTEPERKAMREERNKLDEQMQGMLQQGSNYRTEGRKVADTPEYQALRTRYDELGEKLNPSIKGVPDFPFKESWPDLALKRMLHKAATERNPDGSYRYNAMSWTPGEAQAARYDLSKQLDKVQYSPSDAGGRIVGIKGGQVVVNKGGVPPEQLADHIGKDAAEKLLATNPDAKPHMGKVRSSETPPWDNIQLNGVHELEGEGLKLPHKGMSDFYDKMLVDKANALGKKYGARVGQTEAFVPLQNMVDKESPFIVMHEGNVGPAFPTRAAAQEYIDTNVLDNATIEKNSSIKKQPVHMIPITPALRAAAAKGFPLFALGAVAAGPALQAMREPQPLGDVAAKALATPPPGVR